MVRPNPRFDTINPQLDEWITEAGYTRNLAIEQKLEGDYATIQQYNQDFKGGLNPTTIRELPSWWRIIQHEFGAPYADGYQQQHWTKEQAIEFCNLVVKIATIKKDLNEYRCNNYPRDPAYCSYISGNSSTIGQFLEYGKQLEKEINTNKAPHPHQLSTYPQYYKDVGYLDEQENIIAGMPQWQDTEIIPQVFAEEEINLSDDIIQILNDIDNGVILVPDWFRNNIEWVKDGHITQQEFRTAYNYLVDTQIVAAPEQNLTINDNMITQQVINFNIINGRAVGSIKFVATNNFNPYYYGKNIVNIIQIKDPNGVNILTTVKENRLNFTETERDEVISYDEDVKQNTRATIESFVWSSATTPTAFSKKFMIDISETEPPKPKTSGFMAVGAAGAIAGLVLLGFIVDSKVGK